MAHFENQLSTTSSNQFPTNSSNQLSTTSSNQSSTTSSNQFPTTSSNQLSTLLKDNPTLLFAMKTSLTAVFGLSWIFIILLLFRYQHMKTKKINQMTKSERNRFMLFIYVHGFINFAMMALSLIAKVHLYLEVFQAISVFALFLDCTFFVFFMWSASFLKTYKKIIFIVTFILMCILLSILYVIMPGAFIISIYYQLCVLSTIFRIILLIIIFISSKDPRENEETFL